jgi:ABC-type lipoprotein export system ATPase subunit
MVTHDPAIAARADRRLHIVDGRIACGGEPDAAAGASQAAVFAPVEEVRA